jgi:hypothetical protein
MRTAKGEHHIFSSDRQPKRLTHSKDVGLLLGRNAALALPRRDVGRWETESSRHRPNATEMLEECLCERHGHYVRIIHTKCKGKIP